ncbi:MAG: metal-dependent hydrolase [Pseudomonadota bacterium]|uniref:metal-dependent hydrolase n=1 Tax=Alcanivorax sp. TaxID=1872427 RepID=UPI0024407E43|nr:metal-dependent hydrolase [Alcanivorax sp.]MED5238169.1 metal-dependent hydrolase [Pseudomonadota bacterium]MEE3320937.1 metal-dependent hydrolase [Pseudomonadota bacterium]
MTAQARLNKAIDITVRKLSLRPGKDIDRHFHSGDSFLSAFFAAMSSVFPDGERFFIDSVRHYQDQLDDPELVLHVRRFIGQEAHHGQEHEAFNQWLTDKGYPVGETLRRLSEGLSAARQRLSARQQLAMTLALEHFTAIMAHQFLTMPELSEKMHPEIRELFIWHAVEETEHKAVAFDVYQSVDGGYWNRVLIMLQVTLMFWIAISRITWRNLKSEGNASLGRMMRGYWWLLAKPGPLRKLLPEYLDYFRPGFHPWDQDNRELIRPLQARMAKYEI